MILVSTVMPLKDFMVRLEFSNGEQKVINLEPFLRGPIFEPLRKDPALFHRVRVDEELGTIVWENGADLDPDVLYRTHVPAWMEEAAAV